MATTIEAQILEALQEYEGLRYDGNENHLTGFIEVGEGDRYEITIDLGDYPHSFPSVYETGERIPSVIRRHKFEKTDKCCLTTTARAQVLLKTKIRTLHGFIRLVVIPYFENNSYFEVNGHYSQGEYSHGVDGIIEGYKDILGVDSTTLVLNILSNRHAGMRVKGYAPCYCGSGLKLKKCNRHGENYRHFMYIDKKIIYRDIQLIAWELKRSPLPR